MIAVTSFGMDTNKKLELLAKYSVNPEKMGSMTFEQLKDMPISSISQNLGISAVNAALLKSDIVAAYDVINVVEARKSTFEPYKGKKTRDHCTINFFCLSRPDEDRPPPSKCQYLQAGLGPKKITFDNQNCESADFYALIEENFPKLKGSGGFNFFMLPPGRNSKLQRIPETHPDGFNPRRLSETVGGIKYVRPIQNVLPLTVIRVEASPKMPRFKCSTCNEEFPVVSIAAHVKDCKNQSSVTISDVSDDDFEVPPPVKSPRIVVLSPPRSRQPVSRIPSGSEPVREVSNYEQCPKCGKSFLDPVVLVTHTQCCTVQSLESRKKTLAEELANLKENILAKNGYTDEESAEKIFRVDRNRIWREALRIVKRISVNFCKIGVEFEGEAGVDVGAMWKEMLSLAFTSAIDSMFEGDTYHLPCVSADDAEVCELGKMVAYSILFGGPTFPHLPPSVVSYIINGNDGEMSSTIDEVCGSASQQVTKMLCECIRERKPTSAVFVNETTTVHSMLWEHYTNILCSAGLENKGLEIKAENLEDALQRVINHDVVYGRVRPLNAFRRGLEFCGVLAVLKGHYTDAVPIFTPSSTSAVAEMLLKEMEFKCPEEWEKWFQEYILADDMHSRKAEFNGGTAFEVLLRFATGCPSRPVGGWKPPFRLEADENVNCIKARSCFNKIILPKMLNLDEFRKMFSIALKFGDTFDDI